MTAAERVVWKFGGTSVGDPARLRAVAERLVAAHRQGRQVVAVLSAMGDATDDLARLAHDLAPHPHPREMDALLSVGEVVSCALAAIAVQALGERSVSLTAGQAGVHTDGAYGNARLHRIDADRVTAALDAGAVVLVTGYQGVSDTGDVTTLGRGGSDASAVALAAALGLSHCDIFTDVPGVFTADPRLVPAARRLDGLGHDEMVHLADAGAQVLQPRAVELAAAHGIDIHVRSAFTTEPGTWIRKDPSMFETSTVTGVAHRRRDPVYTVRGMTPATVSGALAARRAAVGAIIRDDGQVRFTVPGAEPADVVAAFAAVDADVTVRADLASVSVVCPAAGERGDITTRMLGALERAGIEVYLVTSTPGRVSGHVADGLVEHAARALHEAFGLDVPAVYADRPGAVVGSGRAA
ncbi:aspartate kinase [Jidongwangia harbinensis]|uniref:aspartate kinase n=1 Tax=Jidongwangia harbinensis TaxID=2878561 RepID=UPI001CD9A696|nr:aspartate kinase [Jidongwangia harbinensis]MCA2217969.1 aspartate kinase [Jidongwangia harbinensis]